MNKQHDRIPAGAGDRAAELDELHFDDDQSSSSALKRPEVDEDNTPLDVGLTEASQPGSGPTDDDLTPERMIREDGARSPQEAGSWSIIPSDQSLSVVDGNEIGAGSGLDEAELAERDPVGVNEQKARDNNE